MLLSLRPVDLYRETSSCYGLQCQRFGIKGLASVMVFKASCLVWSY